MKASEWFQKKLNELEHTSPFKAEAVALLCEDKIAELESQLTAAEAEIERLRKALRGGPVCRIKRNGLLNRFRR